MERVTGVGGIFFRSKDPAALAGWYRDNLGIAVDAGWNGSVFRWPDGQRPDRPGSTVWSIFSADTGYFGAASPSFMVNFRVDDLDAMMRQLRDNGCDVDERVEESEYGRFGWVTDPEGNRVELRQPPPGA